MLFQFRLAKELGMTRRQLLANLDSEELGYWQAFERIEGPIGDWRGDWRAALVAMHVAAAASPGKTCYLADYMPDWKGEREAAVQTEEEMKTEWAAAVAGFNRTPNPEP